MELSEHLEKNINESCLAILTHPMFMHYWSGTTKENSQDPEWQNQAYYFWDAAEPFEKKSLPPAFNKFNIDTKRAESWYRNKKWAKSTHLDGSNKRASL